MGSRLAPSEEFSHLEPISISRISTFASCQAKGYLRYRLKEKPPVDAHYFLVGTIIHEALEGYYLGHNDSPKQAVQQIIMETFEKKGVQHHQLIQAIVASRGERELLEKFRDGTFTKPDGEPYTSPRMTKIWKTESAALGLDKIARELRSVEIPGLKLPDGGLTEMIGRILDLTARYEDSIMISRDKLEEIRPEVGFDFVVDDVRFLGYMDLLAKVKPEFRHEFGGKTWVLADYKTGKAHKLEEHADSAHQSLQLTLYNHAITEELDVCTKDDLYMALHYLDATFAAETTRTDKDFKLILEQAKHYQLNSNTPGLVKRMFYDGMECAGCELRGACIKHFGMPTSISGGPAVLEDDETKWRF